jgi:hypothetical protein
VAGGYHQRRKVKGPAGKSDEACVERGYGRWFPCLRATASASPEVLSSRKDTEIAMTVNTTVPDRPIREDERAHLVLSVLGLKAPNGELVRRAGTFIAVNGFDQVMGAARHTASLSGIDRPWSYTCDAINTNTARLAYLFTMVHWAEVSLRSELDLAWALQYGQAWHEQPIYLDPGQIAALRNDPTQKKIRWTRTGAPDYESPERFMADISLGLLTDMVRWASGTPEGGTAPRAIRPVLWDADGNRLQFQSVVSSMNLLVRIRNEMAHNRPLEHRERGRLWLGRDAYASKVIPGTEDLLRSLRFDLRKANERFWQKQAAVLIEAIVRNGGSDPRVVKTAASAAG